MQKNIFDWLLTQVDLSSEVLPNTSLVEILGDSRILIENHGGVTKYCNDEIRVQVSFGILSVCGTDLKLACITRHRLVITGCIDGVSLLKGCR